MSLENKEPKKVQAIAVYSASGDIICVCYDLAIALRMMPQDGMTAPIDLYV